MSTRRARVKAVISLPPRRKNNEKNDVKSKLTPSNENSKSPRTPQAKKVVETEQTSQPAAIQNEFEKIASPQIIPEAVPIQKTNAIFTPKLPERVPVTAPINSRPRLDVFASPLAKKDSPARSIPSPLTQRINSKTILGLKVTTPVLNIQENVTSRPPSTSSSTKESIKSNDRPDADYNPPSVPESLTDEAVMDGIVLLKPAKTVPKPLDLLKNEIISENAEVLFDPIVPLPSPSKVRPKLRPVPRLMPLRRSSIQGSASESEDESRRALLSSGSHTPATQRQRHDSHTAHATLHSINNRELNRVRNDSVSSNVSQALTHPQPATSPIKEKHPLSKQRRNEMSRRLNAMRKRRETIKRDPLTMYDLIFCNPMNNPMVPDQDEVKAKEANAKDEAERKKAAELEKENPVEETATEEPAPVPQIKLGPNGEIILDEKSLVIQSASKRSVSGVVVEGSWGGSGGGRYTRAARSSDWSADETVRFYRALAALGTDFSLMGPLFPQRPRRELKLKFKKEERINGALVDKALRSQITWDLDSLLAEFEQEREEAKQRIEKQREALLLEKKKQKERIRMANEMRVRPSRGLRALECSALPVSKENPKDTAFTADDLIQQSIEAKKRRRRGKKATEDLNTDPATTNYATLTLIKNKSQTPIVKPIVDTKQTETSSMSKSHVPNIPQNADSVLQMPANIENGSLVVLTVNDPNSPSKKMLQTYISHGSGKLTPVALPPSLLNSVVGYMQKGTPKSTMSESPQLMSPCSAASQDSRTSTTPSVLKPSPHKRQRLSSYSITPL